MFGFMYLVLTAKPVSIRRLCLLYVFLLASARCLLSVLHIEDAGSLALGIAAAITLLAWVSPLVRALFGAFFGRLIPLGAFEAVSGCVQFTYGFTLVLLPVTALETGLAAPHAAMRAALFPEIAWACFGGAAFVTMIQRFNVALAARNIECGRCRGETERPGQYGVYGVSSNEAGTPPLRSQMVLRAAADEPD